MGGGGYFKWPLVDNIVTVLGKDYKVDFAVTLVLLLLVLIILTITYSLMMIIDIAEGGGEVIII